MADRDPSALLDGPRGRRLCWEVLPDGLPGPAWRSAWGQLSVDDTTALVRELSDHVARCDLDRLAALPHPADLIGPLAESVDRAMYWQEPDGLDTALAHPPIRDVLRPVAEALITAPATQWWSTPVDLGGQHEVVFADPDAGAHRRVPPASLREWRDETLDDERHARERPANPRANWSGRWWSTPVFAGLTSSTRSLPPGGPVGLSLVEDSLGWTEASSYLLDRYSSARILEITTPTDWAHLAAAYPLQVTTRPRTPIPLPSRRSEQDF